MKQYKKIIENKKLWRNGGIGAVVLGLLCVFVFDKIGSVIPLEKEEGVQLVECVDGDTARFLIDGKEEKVRFLAIDTPETVKSNTPVQPYGKEASNMTCSLLSGGEDIRLEYEEEKRDKYERLLAWVFVDDKLVQEELVLKGYARVKYLYDDYKYTKRLKEAQTEAQDHKRGLWSK